MSTTFPLGASDTCLLSSRRFVDDLIPFFAVAAVMVWGARLAIGLGQEESGAAQLLGWGGLYSAYVGTLLVCGPPMLVAFLAQWVGHGRSGEPVVTLVVLLLSWAAWAGTFMDLSLIHI